MSARGVSTLPVAEAIDHIAPAPTPAQVEARRRWQRFESRINHLADSGEWRGAAVEAKERVLDDATDSTIATWRKLHPGLRGFFEHVLYATTLSYLTAQDVGRNARDRQELAARALTVAICRLGLEFTFAETVERLPVRVSLRTVKSDFERFSAAMRWASEHGGFARPIPVPARLRFGSLHSRRLESDRPICDVTHPRKDA